LFPLIWATALAAAFNAINHTNFNLPKTSTLGVTDIDAVTSPIFGRITSAKDPRILQLALKMYF